MLLLHPALRHLMRLKTRAWLRSMRRRLTTPSGFLFGLVGFAAMALWIGSLFLRTTWMAEPQPPGAELQAMTRAGIALIAALSIVSALGYRGVYFPKEEIERLLSAPLSRPDLVRYRLWMGLGKSLFFSCIMGWFFSRRMPVPTFGFVGALITLLTLPLLGQGVALLAGDAENRFARWIKFLPLAALRIAISLIFWGFLMLFIFADEILARFPALTNLEGGPLAWMARPPLAHLTAPCAPWANLMTSTTGSQFALMLLVVLGIWVLLFELVARLPIDFRELSLETSADVARRLNRVRSGRATQSSARLRTAGLGWRVPWLFGRSRFGAIAWLQAVGIVRKARGTLFFSCLITAVITAMTTLGGGLGKRPIADAAFVGMLATIYLGWGLRFDFRSSLETMSTIKSWPLPPWKIFLATLLPEIVLVSVLAALAVLVQAFASHHYGAETLAVLPAIPLLATFWFGLDNALFLLYPVRFTPGQGGAMQNTGRQMVLVLLRMLALALVVAAAAGVGYLFWLLAEQAELNATWRAGLALGGALASCVAVLVATIAFGGVMLRRYDPSRPI